MEQGILVKKEMPEYVLKQLICDLNRMILQKDVFKEQYFSISCRSGRDEMWISCREKTGEFLTPSQLEKIDFRQDNTRKTPDEEKAAMILYHKNLYQLFPEIGTVITYRPVYFEQVKRWEMYPENFYTLKYQMPKRFCKDNVPVIMEQEFLTVVGDTLYHAYSILSREDLNFKQKMLGKIKEKEENMTGKISKSEIEDIVKGVLANLQKEFSSPEYLKIMEEPSRSNSIYSRSGKEIDHKAEQKNEFRGVFFNAGDAVEAADKAQKKYVAEFTMEDRERIIQNIRKCALEKKEELASKNIQETKLGRYEDKISKIELVAAKTPGTEALSTYAESGDNGLMIEERGPYGVIGAVSPVTNPVETLLCNAIGMLAAGNAAVFNVHPSSKNVSAYTVDLINRAVTEVGGPENLITMVAVPTMETLQEIIQRPEVKLLCGTGGPGLVKTLLSSGKKAIGAGAGNPPVIVDETADIELAAREILKGSSFENNILCIAEKEVFVLESVADDLIYQMVKQGAYMLNSQEISKIREFALIEDDKKISCGCSGPVKGKYHINKQWVGKDASAFLEKAGISVNGEIRLLIYETDFNDPFVQLEQMMPILPIVRAKSLEEAIRMAVEAEHGNRHTASMFSQNIKNLTEFAKRIGTTIFVKNACTMAGVGFGGEGYTTFTIAGPTGEGITDARSFTRIRRCVLAEGGFRIV